MSVRRNEIHLVDFPFSDSSGAKIRPVVVISRNSYNESEPDVLVCAITHSCYLPITEVDVLNGRLEPGSGVRWDTISRIDKSGFRKKIGKITEEFHSVLAGKILELIV